MADDTKRTTRSAQALLEDLVGSGSWLVAVYRTQLGPIGALRERFATGEFNGLAVARGAIYIADQAGNAVSLGQ